MLRSTIVFLLSKLKGVNTRATCDRSSDAACSGVINNYRQAAGRVRWTTPSAQHVEVLATATPPPPPGVTACRDNHLPGQRLNMYGLPGLPVPWHGMPPL